jgi:hypothetical protein
VEAQDQIVERGARLVIVVPVAVDRAREWRAAAGIATPVWADPEKALYAALGALRPRGTWTLRPAILWRGFVELLHGNVPRKAPGVDPLHQGVDCVVDAGGTIVELHRPVNAGDRLSVADILATLDRLAPRS